MSNGWFSNGGITTKYVGCLDQSVSLSFFFLNMYRGEYKEMFCGLSNKEKNCALCATGPALMNEENSLSRKK